MAMYAMGELVEWLIGKKSTNQERKRIGAVQSEKGLPVIMVVSRYMFRCDDD